MILAPTVAQAQGLPLYTVARGDDQLRTVDPVTGFTLTSVAITITGDTVNGATGLAINPTDGTLFALVRLDSLGTPGVPDPRELVTIDPATGVATSVGNTGDAFADLTFAPDGTLFGVTGKGATTPSTLYTLSTADATPTFVFDFGITRDFGEAIVFNPNDSLIYHASGEGVPNTDEILESYNPANDARVGITLSVDDYDEVLGMTHWSGDMFLVADRFDVTENGLYVVTTSGRIRRMGTLDHTVTGLAFAGAAPACPPQADLYGAALQGPDGPSVFYTIDPADGAPTMIGPIGFERVSGIAFDDAGTLFGAGERMDGSDIGVLITIDPCSGLGTEVGPTGLAGLGFNNVSDIAFAQPDGTLMAVMIAGTTVGFGTIDPATGVASFLGLIASPGAPGNGLADSLGIPIHADATPRLTALDSATGAIFNVLPLIFAAPGADNPRFNALDFNPDGFIFTASHNDRLFGGAPENYLSTVDLGTGVVTIFGQTQDGLDAIAFVPKADLSVSVVDDVDPVVVGSNVTYTVTVFNNGGRNAQGVSISNTIPTGASLVSSTPSQGSCSGSVTCDLGTIAFDAGATVDIVVTPANGGANTNSVTVSSTVAGGDPNPSNDSASQDTVVVGYSVSASPGSSIIKTNSSGTVTVTIASVGGSFDSAVALSCGTLPSGVSCSFSPASVTPGAGSGSSTLTITHGKKIGAWMVPPLGPLPLGLLMAALLGLLTLSLFLVARRSPQFKLRLFLPAALLLGGVMLLSACGGTKAVSYSATINATFGSIAKTATVNVSTK